MSRLSDALAAMVEREAFEYDNSTLEKALASQNFAIETEDTINAATISALEWIKRALPLFRDAQCGIDNAFGEGSKICEQIDALLKEATE